MKHLLLLTILLICGINPNIIAQSKKPSNALSQQILTLTNQHRASQGLPPLKLSEQASQEALQHSKNMATGKVPFSHEGFNARSAKLSKLIKNTTATGENVAYGAQSAQEVMDMWLNSKVHRENIEGQFNLIGIGVAKSKEGTNYFTQIFVRNN